MFIYWLNFMINYSAFFLLSSSPRVLLTSRICLISCINRIILSVSSSSSTSNSKLLWEAKFNNLEISSWSIYFTSSIFVSEEVLSAAIGNDYLEEIVVIKGFEVISDLSYDLFLDHATPHTALQWLDQSLNSNFFFSTKQTPCWTLFLYVEIFLLLRILR